MKIDHIIALIAGNRGGAYRFITGELRRRNIRGLAPSHGAILSTLYDHGPVSMQELAKRIDRDKSTVTALVKKLLDGGFVEKAKETGDGRVTIVSLTDKGMALKPDFDDISEMLIARAYRGFSRREQERLVRGLEKMLRNW